jgi:hypothetical protein
MAELALPPGAVRRRAVFGLLDRDGWTWATIKATFWFLFIVFLQAYVPDRAYYFVVSPTIDLGFNAISPINLCPAENKNLPCPAPPGAVIPWEQSPETLNLPNGGRVGAGTFTSGEVVYLVGGRTASGTVPSVLTTTVFEGNLTNWAEAPALPAPRSDFAIATLSGIPYVIGGKDATGATVGNVYRGQISNGQLTGWEEVADLALSEPLSDLAATSTAAGLYVFGGRTSDGLLSNKTWHSELSTTGTPSLGRWAEVTELPLPEARADATGISTGSSVYIVGGTGQNGPVNSTFFLAFDTHGDPRTNNETGRPFGWGVSVGQSAGAALPEARYDFATFVNSGAIHVVGGYDANGAPVTTDLFTVPSPSNGSIVAWRRLEATDMPAARAEATAALVGQHVFVIGGTNDGTNFDATTVRADTAARLPFFKLGLFGVTVPALSIQGEIGQQLGYIVAGSAALGNFVILVIIGWMFSHRRESFRFFEWISRGRFRAPREDEYRT